MDKTSNELNVYTSELYPLLDRYIKKHVTHEVTHYLQINYGFFCHYTENLKTKITRNEEFFDEVGVFVGFFHDNLRSLICLHKFMHLAPIAFVVRAMIEARCNTRFIFLKPEKRFPLYHNYKNIERYMAHFAGTGPKLSEEFLTMIREKFPYWFKTKQTGEIVPQTDWTTEKKSIKMIAIEVGLEKEYSYTYSQTSIFIHCSSIVLNVYQGKAGFSPMPETDMGDMLALTGAHQGIEFLKDIYKFFGIPFPDYEFAMMYSIYVELDKKFKNPSKKRL